MEQLLIIEDDIGLNQGLSKALKADDRQIISCQDLKAAKGQAHYFVYKKDTKDRTLTRIKQLEGEERVNEVARMLSGASLTEASLANAKDLLGIKD